MANLNVDKRIFESPPFMHRVYCRYNKKCPGGTPKRCFMCV